VSRALDAESTFVRIPVRLARPGDGENSVFG
jgi:hypothetical protein